MVRLELGRGIDVGGEYGPYRQTERLELYKKYTDQLLAEGKAYYCYCTDEELEAETVQWCREILANSPIAIRCLKAALNADCDGQAGLQELAGNATLLYYMTEEGKEGKEAFLEKRRPNFKKFPRLP